MTELPKLPRPTGTLTFLYTDIEGTTTLCTAATLWCEKATAMTGTKWCYLKVAQKELEKPQPADFGDLTVLADF
jgi:hypothetical protein